MGVGPDRYSKVRNLTQGAFRHLQRDDKRPEEPQPMEYSPDKSSTTQQKTTGGVFNQQPEQIQKGSFADNLAYNWRASRLGLPTRRFRTRWGFENGSSKFIAAPKGIDPSHWSIKKAVEILEGNSRSESSRNHHQATGFGAGTNRNGPGEDQDAAPTIENWFLARVNSQTGKIRDIQPIVPDAKEEPAADQHSKTGVEESSGTNPPDVPDWPESPISDWSDISEQGEIRHWQANYTQAFHSNPPSESSWTGVEEQSPEESLEPHLDKSDSSDGLHHEGWTPGTDSSASSVELFQSPDWNL